MLIFSSIFCLFMEGKSSIDFAFTLWDDRYARAWIEPMGAVIIPQMIFYAGFFLITAFIVALIITRNIAKQISFVFLLIFAVLIIIYSALFGIVVETYLGSRHGPAGWLILEHPWFSVIIFNLALALGLIGLWIVISQEMPIEPKSLNRKETYKILNYNTVT